MRMIEPKPWRVECTDGLFKGSFFMHTFPRGEPHLGDRIAIPIGRTIYMVTLISPAQKEVCVNVIDESLYPREQEAPSLV